MKQKKFYLTLAASMMLAVTGFTSCTIEDNSVIPDQGGEDEPEIIVPEEDPFDEGNLVKNGNASKDDVANFLSHDFLDPDGEKAVNPGPGPARIIVDPTDKTNRCFVVGTNNNVTNAWDSQFFITIGEDQIINEKDKFTLKFKYRADKAQSGVAIQSHTNPGGYHGNLPGKFNISFTEEWQEFDSGEIDVIASPGWGAPEAKAGFYTFAFNLSDKNLGGNTIYFDDIRVEVNRYDPFDDGNLVKNGKLEKTDFSSFLSHDFVDPDGAKAVEPGPGPVRVIADPKNEANHCIIVGTNNNVTNAWDSQFFITIGEDQVINEGDKFILQFKYRADKAQDGVAIQSHTNPGGYHGNLPGKFNINFTEEWQEFDSGEIDVIASPGWGAPEAKAGFYTFAFNLSNKDLGGNNIYFDDIKVVVKRVPPVEYEWEEIQINGDFEGEDVSGIACREKGKPDQYVIKDGIGKNNTRGTYVISADNADQVWDTQFFVVLKEGIPAGTKYKFQMDVRADDEVEAVSAQIHAKPGDYIGGSGINQFKVTTEWTTIKGEGTFASKKNEAEEEVLPQSFAFNLNENKTLKTTFYFDNVKVWIGKEKK